MNLTKLFETQKILRDRINYNELDRFDKLILALMVELGECANEWRGFKFWSQDQEPRTQINTCEHCIDRVLDKCCGCEGEMYKNPLLEEYVDGLHFVLEIGLEIRMNDYKPIELISFHDSVTTVDFNTIYYLISKLEQTTLLFDKSNYKTLFNNFLHLGKMLGFTWEQIEQAYFDKNKINHQRQSEGY